MKKLFLGVVVAALAMPLPAVAETWEKASLIDGDICLEKFKSNPDSHPTSCLIKCASSGYGILTADGNWLKFDDAGNKKTLTALKSTKKKDHVRVNVTGEKKGDTIQVSSVTIPE